MRSYLALYLMLWAAGAGAQEPAGVIEGIVRDASTRAPIANVEVSLTPRYPARANTDAQGGFRLEHVAAGDYTLRYNKPGYMGSNITGTGKSVHVPDGAVSERVTVELYRIASIDGAVLDEEGRPMRGVLVHTPSGNGTSTTDDAGRYSMEVLIPRSGRIELRVPYEIRRKTLTRDDTTGETFGYANTKFYPGQVDFAPGLQLHGFDVRLHRTRLVTLAGHAVDLAKSGNLEIELLPDGSPLPDETYGRRPAGSEGAFRFDLIEPGRYTLLAYRGTEQGALPFVVPVDVPKAGLDDMKVPVPAFVPIRGVTPNWSGRLDIRLRAPGLPGITTDFTITERPEFTLEDVPPGRWWVQASAVIAPPRVVTAIRFGSQTAADPLVVAEGGNPPLEIIISDQTGSIAGTVLGESQNPIRGALVIVRRPEESMRFPGYRSGPDGSFRAPDLAPGTYEVSAWEERGSVMDGPPRGTGHIAIVEVKAGETSMVHLVIGRL